MEELFNLMTSSEADAPSVLDFLGGLTASALLSALIAFHPVRWRHARNRSRATRLAHSKILLAFAGTILVMVLGQSAVLALGLVGMGSFVRFRTAIRDPVDTAIIFILVGLGMACGMQLYAYAFTATGFLWVLMLVLVPTKDEPKKKTAKVQEVADEPKVVRGVARVLLEEIIDEAETRLATDEIELEEEE
jgi:uncharacterized membrane protein YhiD involved in acid resistance